MHVDIKTALIAGGFAIFTSFVALIPWLLKEFSSDEQIAESYNGIETKMTVRPKALAIRDDANQFAMSINNGSNTLVEVFPAICAYSLSSMPKNHCLSKDIRDGIVIGFYHSADLTPEFAFRQFNPDDGNQTLEPGETKAIIYTDPYADEGTLTQTYSLAACTFGFGIGIEDFFVGRLSETQLLC